MTHTEKLAVCSGKNINKVEFFVTFEQLQKYCSFTYAKKLIKAHENGDLYGLYITPSGKIKGIFIL